MGRNVYYYEIMDEVKPLTQRSIANTLTFRPHQKDLASTSNVTLPFFWKILSYVFHLSTQPSCNPLRTALLITLQQVKFFVNATASRPYQVHRFLKDSHPLTRFWPPLWSSGQSSWLQIGDVLCFLWGTNWIYICYVEESRPPLWSSGQSSWLQNG
jgi:hypothetical protein